MIILSSVEQYCLNITKLLFCWHVFKQEKAKVRYDYVWT